jgi:hypothetical protein
MRKLFFTLFLLATACSKSSDIPTPSYDPCYNYKLLMMDKKWINLVEHWADENVFSKNLTERLTMPAQSSMALTSHTFPSEEKYEFLKNSRAYLLDEITEGNFTAVSIGMRNLSGILITKSGFDHFRKTSYVNIPDNAFTRLTSRTVYLCVLPR